MPFKQFVLGILIFILPLIASSGESKIKKYFDQKEYGKIVEIITSVKANKISGVRDYRICGQTAFMYGLYSESEQYYKKVVAINKNILSNQDLMNYAFSLLRQGKGDQILSNSIFKGKNESNPWIKHLMYIAGERDNFNLKKDSVVTSEKLTADFLSQYGLNYFDNHIYYSYSLFSDETKSNLYETALINDRRNELAGIKKGRIAANGSLLSSEILKKNMKRSTRIASMNVTDKNENYFATIVPRGGKPEQIVIHGNLYPPFPFNSTKYANAMPYFDKMGQRLYYCSTMPGGIGGWDIYYTELKNGQWTARVNLGPKVNTPFDELFPSVYKDLLIFSSEAQVGLGGFDNYIYSLTTGKLENLWPFNTKGDDLSFRIIQSDPFKAVGVNVPNAKYYLSDYDLESILNPNERKPLGKPVINNEVIEAPIAVIETPKEVVEAPIAVVPVPKEVVEEPKAVVETPMEVVEAPVAVVPVPKEDVEEPKTITEEPKAVVETQMEVVEAPAAVVPVPKEVIEEPKAIIEEHKIVVETPEEVVESPVAVVPVPEEVVEEPKTITEEPKTVVETPIEVVEAPAVAVSVPKEVVEEPKAIQEEPKAVDEIPKKIVESPVAVVPVPEEVVEEPKAIIEEPKIVVETPEKAVESPVAIVPVPKEVVEESRTVAEIPKQILKDTIQSLVIPNSSISELPKSDESAILDSESGDLLLGNLYYDLNSAVFKSVHYAVLDSIVKKIIEKDCKNIIVWSFTDRVGAEKYNGNLAFQRALGVVEYLKSKFQESTNKVYFTVAAGEYFANTTRETNAGDRRAEIYSSKKGLPFNVVYAYKPSKWETAEAIAKTFNNNYDSLKELNKNTPENRINSEIVYVGIQGIHVTSPGETIYRISQKYRCTIEQLLKANHKVNYDLSVAEKLIIPLPLSN